MSGRTLRTVVIGLCAVAAVIIVVGLFNRSNGDSSTTTTSASQAERWADGTCNALATWRTDVTTAANELSTNRTREGIRQAAEATKEATRSFTAAIRDLGKPGTSAGTQAQTTVQTLQTQLGDGAAKIEAAFSNVSGLAGSVEAISTISATLVTMRDHVKTATDSFRALPRGELKQAFATSPSCVTLSSGGSS
jgi:hypothetical protein